MFDPFAMRAIARGRATRKYAFQCPLQLRPGAAQPSFDGTFGHPAIARDVGDGLVVEVLRLEELGVRSAQPRRTCGKTRACCPAMIRT